MNFFMTIKRKALPLFQMIFSLIWLSNLAHTDAYFSVYVLIAFFSFYLQIKRTVYDQCCSRKEKIGVLFLSVAFSVTVLLSNYPLFTTIGDPAVIGRGTSILMNLIDGFFSLIGGICVFYPVLRFFFQYFPIHNKSFSAHKWEKFLPLFIFCSIFGLNLIHLFLVEYPGNVTEDPFTQISEMVSGQYSNFNTFWHTMLFQGILSVGYLFFSDINASIALFCVVQTLIMAFAFTYCLMTMRLYGVPKGVLIATYLIYAVIPYNIALSITIWKDVLFAGGCLLVISSLFRIQTGLGKKSIWNYAVLVFGSILFILSRTNGWLIYLVSAFVMLLFCRKNLGFLAVLGVMSVFGWFLLNPALSTLNVEGGDLVESLSIPVQQVSRVIAEGGSLTEEEEVLLSRVIDLEEVPELYTEWLSDPMKVELRSKDYDYFLENFNAYRDLWIRLGMRYPWQYLKAWVEQTKGYWNAGYPYGLYSETITDNPYGAEKTGGGNIVAALFRLYFGLSRHLIFFEPLHSIGLHVWIVILCFLLNIVRRREQFIISVPVLLLVVGLWFGTPVYCCFRYVYPLFVSFPLIVSTALYAPEKM